MRCCTPRGGSTISGKVVTTSPWTTRTRRHSKAPSRPCMLLSLRCRPPLRPNISLSRCRTATRARLRLARRITECSRRRRSRALRQVLTRTVRQKGEIAQALSTTTTFTQTSRANRWIPTLYLTAIPAPRSARAICTAWQACRIPRCINPMPTRTLGQDQWGQLSILDSNFAI